MAQLQYSEFEQQKEDASDITKYLFDKSMHRGEINYDGTTTYDYSTPQRQRHTSDDFDLLEHMNSALTPSSVSTMQDLQENVDRIKKGSA